MRSDILSLGTREIYLSSVSACGVSRTVYHWTLCLPGLWDLCLPCPTSCSRSRRENKPGAHCECEGTPTPTYLHVSWARPGEMPLPSCNDQCVIPPGWLEHLFCGRAGLALAACREPVFRGLWSIEGNKAVCKLTQCGNACSRNKRKEGAATPRDFLIGGGSPDRNPQGGKGTSESKGVGALTSRCVIVAHLLNAAKWPAESD